MFKLSYVIFILYYKLLFYLTLGIILFQVSKSDESLWCKKQTSIDTSWTVVGTSDFFFKQMFLAK